MSRQLPRLTRTAISSLRTSTPFRLCASLPTRSAQATLSRTPRCIRFASSDASPASATDPALSRADELMEQATTALEDGNVELAKKLYEESLGVSEGPNAWFNLGVTGFSAADQVVLEADMQVCEYHLKNTEGAIKAWEKSLALSPSPDAYTNLASAYILSKPPQPALAIKHLTSALELSPDDPEIAFNLAAILESTGSLEHSLKLYQRAEKGGVNRAKQNIRSVSAKILGQKAAAAMASSSGTSP